MESKPLNVLVAYDGSEPSRRALDRVRTFVPNANVAVVSVAAPVYRDPMLPKFADEDEELRQQKALAEATALLAESGIDARGTAPVGDAATEIVRVAEESAADLIVLGARGLNPLKRVLLGSVSTKVLHHAPCDVLVVK
ncbi:MAG TPA: universal stress protein [Gaiellaceae bacterium]|nr:universal stress protein [Gaiellaceae bacterium]